MKTKHLLFYLCFLLLGYSSNAQTLPTLWGVSANGGFGDGTLFKITGTVSAPVFSTMYTFPNDSGNFPEGTLVHAADGNLYGVTRQGTAGFNEDQGGVIYRYNLSNGGLQYIYDFGGQNAINPSSFDGDGPVEGMVQAGTNGLLYGTTDDGDIGNGTLYSIDPNNLSIPDATYVTIHAFDDDSNFDDGQEAQYGIPFYASDHKIYATTRGGNNTAVDGVLYSYDPSNGNPSTNYNVLVRFDGNNSFPGNYPGGNLIQSSVDNKIYGTTAHGGIGYTGFGTGNGVIYSYTIGGGYSAIYNFAGGTGDGANPFNGLVEATNHKLYGMTQNGGTNGLGVIYSFDPAHPTNPPVVLYNFDGTNGGNPTGVLMQASDGNIYGMTTFGGTDFSGANTGNGVVFSFNLTGNVYTPLIYLSGNGGSTPGANPNGAFIEVAPPASNPTISVNTPSAYCSGSGSATLTASCNTNCTGITYTWAPNINLTATTGASVTATPTITTTYTVTGTNGSGGTATATSVVMVNVAPTAPVATAGTGATNSQITANWNSVGGATGYFLDVATDMGFTGFVTGFNNLSVGNVLTKNVTGLALGTTYYYRVRATNGTCTSTNSNTITYATAGSGATCPFVGGFVTKPFIIICSSGTTTLTVTGSTGNNYNWQISTDNTNWSDISGATTTTYTTAGSDGTTNKFYRLMSKSTSCWNVTSDITEVDVSNPTITVTASSITDNTLILNWSPVGSGNYNITYSGTSSGFLTGITPPKTITGLTAGGSYSMVVSQTGVSGCSASGTVSVNTLCAEPTNLTATPSTVGTTQELTVSWSGAAGNYRVFYRPLYSYITFFTKDVANANSVVITKQGNNNLYASTTYQVYVSRLDCPGAGNLGQPTSSIYVTTLPNPVVSCATPTIDTVFSSCPVLLEVQLHGSPTGNYNVYIQRLTPTLQAVNSYSISSGDFVINATAGQQYLISADSRCGSVVSTLNIWHNQVTVKPICNAPANVVLSNPTCHGFTASWNADQCISNTVSGYDLYMRQAGSINYNAYSVSLSVAPVGPHELVNWLGEGKNMQVFVQSVYSCGGSVTYGPSSQVATITTQSAGCRDEEPTDQLQETKPAVQQYSANNDEVFSLYPNPNTGEFTVDLSRLSNNSDEVRIEVINMIGQTVITQITSISDGHMSEFINLPNGTAAGTYIVRLTAGKNVYTAKVNISR